MNIFFIKIGETKQICAPGAICQNNLCISENNILNGVNKNKILYIFVFFSSPC